MSARSRTQEPPRCRRGGRSMILGFCGVWWSPIGCGGGGTPMLLPRRARRQALSSTGKVLSPEYYRRLPSIILRYSENQISKMEEANQIRKSAEPTELIQLVSQLKERLLIEEKVEELPQHLKQKLIYEIVDRLRSLDSAANGTEQRDAVESWRRQKLKEAKKLIRGKKLNTTIFPEEAGAVSRALGSYWSGLSDEIGLWIPVEIFNNEHDDKSDSDEEFDEEILPGKKLPPECHAELHTDYDGAAVRWSLTHHKDSAYECCMSCLDQARRAKPGEMKCNVWVYCPSETGCYSPDIYEHRNGECWLKYSETLKLNFKDKYPESYRDEHVNAPVVVPWASGVVSM